MKAVATFQVKLFPQGEYRKVEARSAKDAAEKQYGRALSEVGSNHEVRVMAHAMIWPRGPTPILFYDRG
jgi:hypothetical protein